VQGGLLAGLTSRGSSACDGNRRRSLESGPAIVSLFLAGRFGSHVVAGALLGLAGSAVQLGPDVRAALLVVAGVVVMVFGVRLFGREPAGCAPRRALPSPAAVPGIRAIISRVGAIRPIISGTIPPEGVATASGTETIPPEVRATALGTGRPEGGTTASETETVRPGVRATDSGTDHLGVRVTASETETIHPEIGATPSGAGRSGGRAVALGAATILLPCGVTLGVEVVAVSSGSALGGAAAMAGLVVGTAPAFALLGLVMRRAATTRLAALAGIVALVTGGWTIVSGLSLGGWLPGSVGSPAAAAATVHADGTQRIDVWATDRGYRPGVVTARAGVPAEIVFHLTGTPGCTRMLTIDGRDVALPATVRLDPRPPGSLRYVCSMGMYVGFITFL
jgi:uncharacterized protein